MICKIDSYIDDFLTYLNLEQNAAPNTLKSYRLNLNEFSKWNQERGTTVLSNLTIQDFVQYLREQKGNSSNTIAQKLASLKSFFNYLTSVKVVAPRLDGTYKKIKTEAIALSREELDSLLLAAKDKYHKTCNTLSNATGKTSLLQKQLAACSRDILMLLLLAGTGLRISELCSVNIGDLDMENGSFTVNGKGYKKRLVYFDLPEIRTALVNYLSLRFILTQEKEPLFTNLKDGCRLSVRGAQYIFQAHVKSANLSKNTTPHTLRHTFATLSIEMGANIKAVSQLLGHAQVGTTLKMYTHLSPEYVRKVFQLCNPFTEKVFSLEEAVNARRSSLLFINDRTNHWQRRAIAGDG